MVPSNRPSDVTTPWTTACSSSETNSQQFISIVHSSKQHSILSNYINKILNHNILRIERGYNEDMDGGDRARECTLGTV